MTVYSSHSPRDGWLITSFKEGELGTERFRDSPNITQLVSVPESARTRASSTPTAGPAEKPRLSQSHLNRRDVNFDDPESSQAELWGWRGRGAREGQRPGLWGQTCSAHRAATGCRVPQACARCPELSDSSTCLWADVLESLRTPKIMVYTKITV